MNERPRKSAPRPASAPSSRRARARRRMLLVAGIVVVAIALAAAVPFIRSWQRAARIAEGRRQGLALYEAGRHEEALPHLAMAARDAGDLEAVIALAESRRRVPENDRQHLVTAAGYFRAVLRQDDARIEAWRGLLECAIGLGYLAEIPEIAAKVLSIAPDDRRAMEAILETRFAQARWSEAALAARSLQALEPDAVRWRAAELGSLRAGGADAAGRLALVRDWRTARPGDDGLALLEADLLRETGREQESRSILEAIVAHGVGELDLLEAVLESLDAMGLEALADDAVAGSRAMIDDPAAAARIEARRHLRAGRLSEVAPLLLGDHGVDGASTAEGMRLVLAAACLAGDRDEAARIAASTVLADDVDAALVRRALSREPIRARIEGVLSAHGARPVDPMIAAVLSDLYLEAGELEEAHGVVVAAYEATGRRFQPLGLRLVRGARALGRHPEALAACRTLALRSPRDPAVALVLLEAWAAALSAGHEEELPASRLSLPPGASLERYWNAVGAPVALAPAVASALAATGRTDDAIALLEPFAAGAAGEGTDDEAALLEALGVADEHAPHLSASIERRIVLGAPSAPSVLALAARMSDAGRDAEARALVEEAMAREEGDARARAALSRWLDLLADGRSQGAAGLLARLEQDPSPETAALVLSRSSAWSDERVVAAAVDAMRAALGDHSLRAAVAGAVLVLVFHEDDPARIAASIAGLDAALRRAPDSVSVLTTLARLLRANTPPDDVGAAELLVRAADLQPAALEVYPELVSALQEIGDYAAAERAIERYIRMAGSDLGAQRRAASMQEQRGRLVEAATLHELIAGRTREAVDRLALARVRQRLGRTDEARTILLELLAESPDPLVVRELALVEARDSGIERAREVLRVHGTTLDASRLLAIGSDLESQYGDARAALDDARRWSELEGSAAAHRQRCRLAMRLGSTEEARASLRVAVELAPRDPELLPLAASLLLGDAASREELRAVLARIEGGRADLVDAVALLVRATRDDGTVDVGAATLAEARDLALRHASSPVAWRVLVEMLRLSGREADAAMAARTAFSRLPNDPGIARLATETAFAAGLLDEAAAAAAAWRKQGGAEVLEASAALAMIDAARGRLAAALRELAPHADELVRRPRSIDALRALVLCRVVTGEADGLAADFRSADGPAAEHAGTVVGAWMEGVQSLPPAAASKALQALDSILGADPRSAHALAAAATLVCRTGEPDACDLASRSVARVETDDRVRPLLEADLAAARGDLDLSARLYESLYGAALRALGDAGLEQAGRRPLPDPAEAATVRAAARGVLVSDPIAVAALHNHAESLLSSGREADALPLAFLAAEAMPESPELAETLARALLADGRADDALRVLDGFPDRLSPVVTRAEVLLALDRATDARMAVARALTLAGRSVAVPWSLRERLRDAERRSIAGAASARRSSTPEGAVMEPVDSAARGGGKAKQS